MRGAGRRRGGKDGNAGKKREGEEREERERKWGSPRVSLNFPSYAEMYLQILLITLGLSARTYRAPGGSNSVTTSKLHQTMQLLSVFSYEMLYFVNGRIVRSQLILTNV